MNYLIAYLIGASWGYLYYKYQAPKTPLAEKEIEMFDNLKKYIDDRINQLEADINWKDFSPVKTEFENFGKFGKTDFGTTQKDKSHNPDEIETKFDSLFETKD